MVQVWTVFGKREKFKKELCCFWKNNWKKKFCRSPEIQRTFFCHSHLHHRSIVYIYSIFYHFFFIFGLKCLHFYSIWTCRVVDRRGCYRLWTHVVHNPQTQTIGRRSDSNSAPLPHTSQYCPQNTYRRQKIRHG